MVRCMCPGRGGGGVGVAGGSHVFLGGGGGVLGLGG